MNKESIYEIITNRVLIALEEGVVPWHRPWSTLGGTAPQNVDGRPYQGINVILLGMTEFSDPRWVTFKKAKSLNGNVRKGEKGMPVIFWKPMQKYTKGEDGKKVYLDEMYFLLRYYTVFNVEQCDDLDIEPFIVPVGNEFSPILEAEKIVRNMDKKPKVNHGGDSAYYIPARDSIHMPLKEAFDSPEEYYSTLFHELSHSTGHETRLNRHELETGIAPFGSATYSKEELVAEFSATFLCHASGITNTIDNSEAYITGWAEKIKKDKKLVVNSASLGQKASEWIKPL